MFLSHMGVSLSQANTYTSSVRKQKYATQTTTTELLISGKIDFKTKKYVTDDKQDTFNDKRVNLLEKHTNQKIVST